jgi:hypothetical protein
MDKYDEDNGVLTINEFELHDITAGLNSDNTVLKLIGIEGEGGGAPRIRLIIKDTERMDEYTRTVLENFANQVLGMLNTLDNVMHQLAGYTC